MGPVSAGGGRERQRPALERRCEPGMEREGAAEGAKEGVE